MLSSLKGGFFFFFASCMVVMGLLVLWLVPETKGRSLEGMDEVFGSAYGVVDAVGLELRSFRRERGLETKEADGELRAVKGEVDDREVRPVGDEEIGQAEDE